MAVGSLSRLRGRAGVGVPDRNEPLEFSPTRRALASALTSPTRGEGISKSPYFFGIAALSFSASLMFIL